MPDHTMNHTPSTPKLAYIDGSLAAFLFQGAVGALLAGLLYLKIYWQKVKAFFTKDHSGTASGGPGEGGSDS